VDSLLRDIRFGLRALLKDRSFSIVSIFTLALGIGAATAIVSVVQSVLLHALPFADSDSLVFLLETVGTGVGSVSYPNYLDWRDQNHVFSELAAYSSSDLSLTATGAAERIYGEVVTDSYFPLLRINPILGRNFSAEENQNPGASPVVIISHGLWKREFGQAAEVLGRTLKVNEATFTIVGVAPETFSGVTGRADVWVPLSMRDLLWPQSAQFHFNSQRDIHWHRVVGRLKPGITLNQARDEMRAIGSRLAEGYPQANKERGVQVTPASEAYLGRVRSPLLLLLGAAGCIFLISCFNVGNLFLIRAASRENEIAVMSALGAGWRRVAQQWIVEGVIVALAGGVAGFALARWSIGAIVSVLPVRLPTFSTVQMNPSVFALTCIASIFTGALLGLVAALRVSNRDIVSSLKDSARSSTGFLGLRTSAFLVTAEIAVAVVVTIGAGLLVRSFQQLRHADPGFAADHLFTARFDVPVKKYTDEERLRVGPQILDRIASLPQVRSAALTILDPFVWGGINRGITVEHHSPLSAAEQDEIYVQEISPKYFETMKIPMHGGRDFTARDDSSAPHVVIVSHAFAQRYWPGQEVVGKKLKYGPANSKYGWMEIVGEVGDVRFASLRADPNSSMVIYAPLSQSEVIINMSILVRTRTEPASVANLLRQEIQRFDSEIPVYSMATMEERMEGEAEATRSFAVLLATFAFLGIGLAAVGVYAAMAARVSGRTREIGIRIALGAQPMAVLRMVLSQGAQIGVFGVGVGLAIGLWASRLLVAQLYGVGSTDLLTFSVAATLLCAVVVAACCIPARRAMRIDPISALRQE
jgi:putative ABC transport system permease protein